MNMEKPLLVIIAEAHPSGIEMMLIATGEMSILTKEQSGRKKVVLDRSAGLDASKKWMRRIRDEVIEQETELLRKEKITRLLVERPASREGKRLYAGFRLGKDLSVLRSGLRRENARLNAQTMKEILDLFSELGLWKPLLDTFMAHYRRLDETSTQPIFALSHVSIAAKAGISDLVPVDDEKGFRQAGALLDAMYVLDQTIMQFCRESPVLEHEKLGADVRDKVMGEFRRISAIVNRRIGSVDAEREAAMCRNILASFVPGSALLCGIEHLGPLERQLSQRFRVRSYKVGESLLNSIERK